MQNYVAQAPEQHIRDTACDMAHEFGACMPDSRFDHGGGTPETALIKVTAPELVDLLERAIKRGAAGMTAPVADEDIARAFHEAYERLAPEFGYRTREASAKPWAEVPANNRALMTATVHEVRALLPRPSA